MTIHVHLLMAEKEGVILSDVIRDVKANTSKEIAISSKRDS